MHHYPFHVGDYKAHSAHLDLLEDLAYRRMLDFVYLNEMPLPESIEEIARLICMRSNYDCITVVLREFFYRTDCGGWMNKRAALEISKYHEKSDKAKASIAARWDKVNKTKAEADTDVLPANYERNTNQNQNQNQNQKPITNKLTSSGDDKPVKIDYQAIVDLFNSTLPELPSVKILTDKRRSAIRSCCLVKPRFSELGFWEVYFQEVRKSDFLMGRSKDWKADFDFLTTRSKFVKVVEGGY